MGLPWQSSGRTSPFSAGGTGSDPGWGAKLPHASRPKNQNMEQMQYCNKFNKNFKNIYIKKQIHTHRHTHAHTPWIVADTPWPFFNLVSISYLYCKRILYCHQKNEVDLYILERCL